VVTDTISGVTTIMTIAPLSHHDHRSVENDGDRFRPLRAWLAGDLITPDSPAYDQRRKVQDLTLDRRPLAIVRAADPEDVASTVRYARKHDLPLAVRSGGHSLARQSMIDGALVVDLSGLNAVRFDTEARIAWAQAGITSGNLVGAAHAHGLALSTGDTSSVGLGGLATGGGIGFMARKYGLTIDNLVSAEVVLADGQIVTASADEHPDLFWAIRGGGGNVGIVTELELQMAPVSQVVGGEIVLPASREVIRGYLEYAAAAPDDLTTLGNLIQAPPAPFIPAERVGEAVLSILVCWTGSPADGERALAPLRALAEPVADTVSTIPYPALYDFTAHHAEPSGWALRSMFADDLSDATLDGALLAMERASSPFSLIQFRGLGGAMARVGRDATAFPHRDRRYLMLMVGVWLDAAEDAAPHRAWTESLWQAVRHDGAGAYVNFLEDEGEGRVREAYGDATLARLAEVKRRYDPMNLFRFNQNVRPRS
jgi:FAD/FMN-containing dehydrogenase